MENKVINFVNPQSEKRMNERATRMIQKFPHFVFKRPTHIGCNNGY